MKHKKKGLTLVEILVALVMLAALILVAAGLLVPLQLTRTSSNDTQALTYARSYLELVRQRWLDPAKYEKTPTNTSIDPEWPTSGTTTAQDLRLPSGWILTKSAVVRVNSAYTDGLISFSTSSNLPRLRDTLREVTVEVKPANGPSVTLSTLISLTNP